MLFRSSLRAGGVLLLSGFYESDIPDIRTEAVKCGLEFIRQRVENGWACLHFRRDRSLRTEEIL